MGTMRALVPALIVCAALPGTASGAPHMRVSLDGPAIVGQTVGIVVQARADGARLTFPDLQGELGTSACTLSSRRGVKRFVLPYRPTWAGRHMLTVSVSSGACGGAPRVRWRPLEIEVAPPAAPSSRAAPEAPGGSCRRAGTAPRRRHARAAGAALLCLLNAERRARGLRALLPSRLLERAAASRAHRPRSRSRGGEHVMTGTGAHTNPRSVLRAWLAADAHRTDLLSPGLGSAGVAVAPGRRGPLRLRGATWVLEVA